MFGTSGIEEYISGGAFPSCLSIRNTLHLLLERVISLKPITDADPVDGLYEKNIPPIPAIPTDFFMPPAANRLAYILPIYR
jgi:hypothetical protein